MTFYISLYSQRLTIYLVMSSFLKKKPTPNVLTINTNNPNYREAISNNISLSSIFSIKVLDCLVYMRSGTCNICFLSNVSVLTYVVFIQFYCWYSFQSLAYSNNYSVLLLLLVLFYKLPIQSRCIFSKTLIYLNYI